MDSILVVEDTESLREVLCNVLECEGYQVVGAGSAEEGLELFADNEFNMVLCDLKLPHKSGIEFLKESKELDRKVPVIVMTAYGTIDIAVDAMKLGATDFVTKPFDPTNLVNLIGQIIEHRRIVDRDLGVSGKRSRKLVTQSAAMDEVLSHARKVAPLSSSVLILGESGTGKELLARYIHEQSPRIEKPFVAVNCASMPSELLESEFFGHEAGSFTGATEQRLGLFEVADNGTIFLDEIGNMPHELQIKLLRTLQESEIKRIGASSIKKVDVRVISATNCDIDEEIKKGSFRDDLYYRLGVVILELPPLRDRRDDIELLANYFVKSFGQEFEKPLVTIIPESIELLESYHWPGNVRELENVIERAMIFAEDQPITPDMLQLEGDGDLSEDEKKTLPQLVQDVVRQTEVAQILRVLAETGGNKSRAARILGVSYKTLLNKVKEYEIENPSEESASA